MPRHKRRSYTAMLNLDSLVDIVSNNVGILIILAVFMALIALSRDGQAPSDGGAASAEPPPARLEVPWSHPTAKNPVFFVIRGNRVQHLDLEKFYRVLAGKPVNLATLPITVTQTGLTTRFFPVTNHVYCLEFLPQDKAGETWLEAQRPHSRWGKALADYPPERFYYYFWVMGDSFELFREVRRTLNQSRYEVGWRPSLTGKRLEMCNGFEGAAAFQPQ